MRKILQTITQLAYVTVSTSYLPRSLQTESQTIAINHPKEHSGYRKEFSTMDHLNVVSQLIEKCSECKLPEVFGIVDYTKVFDYIEILEVIVALKEQGVKQV